MSRLLEAIEQEIADEDRRHEATLEKLFELRDLAGSLNGAEPSGEAEPDAPAEPEPSAGTAAAGGPAQAQVPPAGQRRHRSAVSDEQLEAKALELLRAGGATPTSVMKAFTGGTGNSGLIRRAQEFFARLEGDGKICKDGSNRGRPTFGMAEEDAPPEPVAGSAVSEAPPAPAGPAMDVGRQDLVVDLDDVELEDVEPPPPVVEIGDYQKPKRAFKPDGRTVRAIELMRDLCRDEPKAIGDFVGTLGLPRGRVVQIVTQSGRFEQYGVRKRPAGGQVPLYRAVLMPAEREGVTIRQADRSGSIEQRTLAILGEHGRQSIERLAARLVLHPRIVAGAVETLIADGDVEKLPGGLYGATDRAAA